jgi:hypothetical protein
MKIKVLGDVSLVFSVSAELTEAGMLSMMVNTRHRWPHFQVSGGWGLFASGCSPEEADLSVVVAIYGPERASDGTEEPVGAEIVFLAETQEEKRLVNGVIFNLLEKDQLQLIAVPRATTGPLASVSELAHWR